jgi:hypothetical protein
MKGLPAAERVFSATTWQVYWRGLLPAIVLGLDGLNERLLPAESHASVPEWRPWHFNGCASERRVQSVRLRSSVCGFGWCPLLSCSRC